MRSSERISNVSRKLFSGTLLSVLFLTAGVILIPMECRSSVRCVKHQPGSTLIRWKGCSKPSLNLFRVVRSIQLVDNELLGQRIILVFVEVILCTASVAVQPCDGRMAIWFEVMGVGFTQFSPSFLAHIQWYPIAGAYA